MSHHPSSHRKAYAQSQKPIVHTRDSSCESSYTTSTHSGFTSDKYYKSSRSSMSHAGFHGGSHSKVVEEGSTERKYRVPDNGCYYVKSKTSRSGKVEVVDQRAGRIVAEEPRSSEARYEDYKNTQKLTNKHRTHR